jgi:hypothetical protein
VRFNGATPQDKKTMLLFVVDGLSYTELAALRFLSNDPAFTYRIVIPTHGSTRSLVHTFYGICLEVKRLRTRLYRDSDQDSDLQQ